MEAAYEFLKGTAKRRPLHERLFNDSLPSEIGFHSQAPPVIRMQSSSRYLRGSKHASSRPPPVIHVSHGCLLIPVFAAAWWYYTKTACRKVVRGFVRNSPEPDKPEKFHDNFTSFGESYAQWEDSIHAYDVDNENSTSDRLVKWINRPNVQRTYQRHGLKVRTREYLYGKDAKESDKSTPIVEKDENCAREDGSASCNSYRSAQWECLPDVGSLELCTLVQNSSSSNGVVDNSLVERSDDADCSESIVVRVRSRRMATLGSPDAPDERQSNPSNVDMMNTPGPVGTPMPALVDAMV